MILVFLLMFLHGSMGQYCGNCPYYVVSKNGICMDSIYDCKCVGLFGKCSYRNNTDADMNTTITNIHIREIASEFNVCDSNSNWFATWNCKNKYSYIDLCTNLKNIGDVNGKCNYTLPPPSPAPPPPPVLPDNFKVMIQKEYEICNNVKTSCSSLGYCPSCLQNSSKCLNCTSTDKYIYQYCDNIIKIKDAPELYCLKMESICEITSGLYLDIYKSCPDNVSIYVQTDDLKETCKDLEHSGICPGFNFKLTSGCEKAVHNIYLTLIGAFLIYGLLFT